MNFTYVKNKQKFYVAIHDCTKQSVITLVNNMEITQKNIQVCKYDMASLYIISYICIAGIDSYVTDW